MRENFLYEVWALAYNKQNNLIDDYLVYETTNIFDAELFIDSIYDVDDLVNDGLIDKPKNSVYIEILLEQFEQIEPGRFDRKIIENKIMEV